MNPSDSELAGGNGFKRKFVSAVRTWPWKETGNSGSNIGKITSKPLTSAVRGYPPLCGRLSTREEYLRAMIMRGNSCGGEGIGPELEDNDDDDDTGEMEINEGDGVGDDLEGEIGDFNMGVRIRVPQPVGSFEVRVGISEPQHVRSIAHKSSGMESLASRQKNVCKINVVRGGKYVTFSGDIDVQRRPPLPEKMFKSVQKKGKSRDVEGEKNAKDCFYQASKRGSLSHNKIQSHEAFTRDFHPSNDSKVSASRPSIRQAPLLDGRERVLETLRLFREMFKKVSEEGDEKRVDLVAAGRVKKMNKWIGKSLKIVGPTPGVEVGDKFQYRMELHLIGLHGPIQGGIDSITHRGQLIAISIVESGGYQNYAKGTGVLIYMGQGGAYGRKPHEDQKLERGNLALKNSILNKNPVRVIRRQPKSSLHPRAGGNGEMYMYDGLYTVTKYWSEREEHGKLVYKFQLEKIVA